MQLYILDGIVKCCIKAETCRIRSGLEDDEEEMKDGDGCGCEVHASFVNGRYSNQVCVSLTAIDYFLFDEP
jgi:hypothetical protein